MHEEYADISSPFDLNDTSKVYPSQSTYMYGFPVYLLFNDKSSMIKIQYNTMNNHLPTKHYKQ